LSSALPSVAPDAEAQASTLKASRARPPVDASICFAAATALAYLSTHFQGAFYVDAWAPLGIALVGACTALVIGDARPSRAVVAAAALLVLLGVWAALTPLWGGLPDQAWRRLDQSLLAAAALVLGSLVASSDQRRSFVLAGVLAGLTAHAAEMIGRLATGGFPDAWIVRRAVEGPLGYHNAQGVVFAVGLPIALWAASLSVTRPRRAAGGACAGLLLAGLLLTQSRGSLGAAILGVAVFAAWSRSWRVVANAASVACAGIALVFTLRNVDRALLGDAADVAALRRYALWAALAAVTLGLIAALGAVPRLVNRRVRVVLATAGCAALLGGAAAIAIATDWPSRVEHWVSGLSAGVDPDIAAAGSTKYTTASLNERGEIWQVAAEMIADRPLLGTGDGRFAEAWARERPYPSNALHAHSIELELLAELGVVGLALFAAFAVSAVLALRGSPARATAAVGAGVLTVLVTESSIDWTWSFPGIVATTLVVVGAAAGAGRRARGGRIATALTVGVGLVIVASLLAPYLADRQLARATAATAEDPNEAWRLAGSARRLDPWNPAALVLQGQLAEQAGFYRLAASRYLEAADLSKRRWYEVLRASVALERAGASASSQALCAEVLRANPLEPQVIERCGPK
jgi:O-Antigen ligase